ncbi:MAG: hypothetical protein ACFFAN_16725 [Promethearchaeota archaeon]
MDKKDKDILKLSKLLKHWADHNNNHKESFLKWQIIARNYGLNQIVENLGKAIEFMDKCSEYLISAHNELERNF